MQKFYFYARRKHPQSIERAIVSLKNSDDLPNRNVFLYSNPIPKAELAAMFYMSGIYVFEHVLLVDPTKGVDVPNSNSVRFNCGDISLVVESYKRVFFNKHKEMV